MMHLFIDESGGTDHKNDVFLLAGVILPAQDAKRIRDRIMKSLRSQDWIREPGSKTAELKSHRLTPPAAFTAFFALEGYDPIFVRVHRRTTTSSGWVFNQVPEYELYERMAVTLVRMAQMYAPLEGVTLDRTRYKRSIETRIRRRLVNATNAALPILFSDSAGQPGVQLADVCANTCFRAYRSLRRGWDVHGYGDLPTYAPSDVIRLKESGLIEVDLEIEGLLPDWLKPFE